MAEDEFKDYLVYAHEGSNGSQQLFMKLGAHHEPFRMRNEVSGRKVMKTLRGFADDGDILALVAPFVVKEDHERLESALDDEDHPVTLGGVLTVTRQCQERYMRSPLAAP